LNAALPISNDRVSLWDSVMRFRIFSSVVAIQNLLFASASMATEKLKISNQPYRVGSWVVVNKIDPITDKPLVMVQTPLDSRAGPFLKLICQDGRPYITFGIPGTTFKENEKVSVALRIDKGEVTRARYMVDGGDQLATALSQVTYRKMAKALLIVAFIERDDGANWTLELPVSRSEDAFKPLTKACPIDEAWTTNPQKYDPSVPADAPQTGPAAPTTTPK
jgi:hypothetical protein